MKKLLILLALCTSGCATTIDYPFASPDQAFVLTRHNDKPVCFWVHGTWPGVYCAYFRGESWDK